MSAPSPPPAWMMRSAGTLAWACLGLAWLWVRTIQAAEPPEAAGTTPPPGPSGLAYEVVIDLRDAGDPSIDSCRDAVIRQERDGTMYWAPRELNRQAEIVYRIDLPAPIEAIVSSNIRVTAYNDNHESGHCYDPGCSAQLHVSVDGATWIEMQTNYPGAPRVDRDIREVPELIGARALYFRARLRVTKAHPRDLYRYAQFLRQNADRRDFERIAFVLRDSLPRVRAPADAAAAVGGP